MQSELICGNTWFLGIVFFGRSFVKIRKAGHFGWQWILLIYFGHASRYNSFFSDLIIVYNCHIIKKKYDFVSPKDLTRVYRMTWFIIAYYTAYDGPICWSQLFTYFCHIFLSKYFLGGIYWALNCRTVKK